MAAKTKTQLEEENKGQIATFRKAARELGCEDNEERFQDALRTIAKAKPSVKERKVSGAGKYKTKHDQE